MRNLWFLVGSFFMVGASTSSASDAPPESFLSSSMYCKDAYLELKERQAPDADVESMASSCQAQHDQNLMDAQKRAEDKATAARIARLPPPRIGMTANTVVSKTRWGAPQSINRTITAGFIREQWVYGNSEYLYLVNGKVSAIQD